MPLAHKNIVITPNIGQNADPTIAFQGANANVNTTVSLYVYPDSNGTLSFQGSAGELFSVTNDLTGSIFTVNDVSGIPLIEVNTTSALISFGQYYGNVIIGQSASIGNTTIVANSTFDIFGSYSNRFIANTPNTINCSSANYFTNTVTGVINFSFISVPQNRAYGFLLELTNGGSGTVTWPASVRWPGGAAPSLTTSGVDLLGFITDDGGTIWRGVASMINSS